jgi:hypothetical protein
VEAVLVEAVGACSQVLHPAQEGGLGGGLHALELAAARAGRGEGGKLLEHRSLDLLEVAAGDRRDLDVELGAEQL